MFMEGWGLVYEGQNEKIILLVKNRSYGPEPSTRASKIFGIVLILKISYFQYQAFIASEATL